MLGKKTINPSYAKKGMTKDTHISQLDETQYTHMMNGVYSDDEGNALNVQNEPSNVLTTRFKRGYVVVGYKLDSIADRLYVFLNNPTTIVSEIGYINIENDFDDTFLDDDLSGDVAQLGTKLEDLEQEETVVYHTLISDECNFCLNFSPLHPIKYIVIHHEKLGTTLYWTDNYNEQRFINLNKLDDYKQEGVETCNDNTLTDTCVDCDKLKVFRDFSIPTIENFSISTGGNIKEGMYETAIAYCDSEGTEISDLFFSGDPIPIFESNNIIITKEEPKAISRTITWKVFNLDKQYEYYKAIILQTTKDGVGNVTVSTFVEGVHQTPDDTIVLSNLTSKVRYDSDALFATNKKYLKSKGILEQGGYLLHFGLEEEPEWNLQPITNLLGSFLRWSSSMAYEKLYEDGIAASKYKSVYRDEVYPYSIRFLTNTGFKTAIFPLIGRPVTTVEDEIVAVNRDTESIQEYIEKDFEDIRTKKWQYYNTATELGSFIDENEDLEYIWSDPKYVNRTCELEGDDGVVEELPTSSFTIPYQDDYESLYTYLEFYKEDFGDTYSDFYNQFFYDKLHNNYTNNSDPLLNCAPTFPGYLPLGVLTSNPTLISHNVSVLDIQNEQVEYIELPIEQHKQSAGVDFADPLLRNSEGGYIDSKDWDGIGKGTDDSDFDSYDFEYGEAPRIGAVVELVRIIPKNEGIKYPLNIEPAFSRLEESAEPRHTRTLFSPVADEAVESELARDKILDTTTNAAPNTTTPIYFQDNVKYPFSNEGTYIKQRILDTQGYVGDVNWYDHVAKTGIWFTSKLIEKRNFIVEISKGSRQTKKSGTLHNSVRVGVYIELFDKSLKLVHTGFLDVEKGGMFEVNATDNNINDIFADENYNYRDGYKIYIAIDSPMKLHTRSSIPGYYITASSMSFGVIVRHKEYENMTISYDSIGLGQENTFEELRRFKIPKLGQTEPVPFKYGDFSYWESLETYSDNKELFDSSELNISPTDIHADYVDEFVEKFTDTVVDDVYTLKDTTDFRCKPIRHFKFPNFNISPFMSSDAVAQFKDSIIYPLGVTISEDILNNFLDIAVKNTLITQKQRDSVVGYELLRGDREGHKSVVAKGLMYDMMKYQFDDEDIYYPNYPYNDLGSDKINTIKGVTGTMRSIPHPYAGASNNKFTFHSPDFQFNAPSSASELVVEAYQYGSSKGFFPEVKDHPKWVILSSKGDRIAKTLASIESVFDTALAVAAVSENFRFGFGFTFSINPVGVVTAIAASVAAIAQAFLLHGKRTYEWKNIFKDLGTPENFAHYYTSEGIYNYAKKNEDEGDMLRAIAGSRKLRSGRYLTTDIGTDKIDKINNVDREWSTYISLGQDKEQETKYNLLYPFEYKSFDNGRLNRNYGSRTYQSTVGIGNRQEFTRRIASPYTTLKKYLPQQYGTVSSVKWKTTGQPIMFNETNNQIIHYGGDIYISRFTFKRKLPLFLESSMGLADRTPFDYSLQYNIGEGQRFYCDYETGDEIRKQSLLFPDSKSVYKFDSSSEQSMYIKKPSKFYLYYYGIPSFLVESEINLNFRQAKKGLKDNFYPNTRDIEEWTQEVKVPIKTDNTYYYNNIYSSVPTKLIKSTPRFLPNTYSKVDYELLSVLKNRIAYSLPDTSDSTLFNPWLIYKPNNFIDIPVAYNEIIDITSISSNHLLCRTSDIGFFVEVRDNSQNITSETQQGKSPLQISKPVEYSKSDLGYGASQSTEIVNSDYGKFWVNAETGQVFRLNDPTSPPTEISLQNGMRKWFKKQLPFKVNRGITKEERVNIDNALNGLGLTLGWDNKNKRLFITKKDVIPKTTEYDFCVSNGEFYNTENVVSIIEEKTAEGYIYDGIENCELKFSKQFDGGITAITDVYAILDTTSMSLADGTTASTELQIWFSQYQVDNPDYTGNLYIIPLGLENYVNYPKLITDGTISPTGGGWTTISIIPSNLYTQAWISPTDLLLLAFVDEVHSQYHKATVVEGFDTQPTNPYYLNDFANFVLEYNNNYNFFRGVLYPIVKDVEAAGGALILQAAAAMKAKIFTQQEIDDLNTTVDVDLLLTENPYANHSSVSALEDYGWLAYYDKLSPASEVFSSEQFATDLNNIINLTTETPPPTEDIRLPVTAVEGDMTQVAVISDGIFNEESSQDMASVRLTDSKIVIIYGWTDLKARVVENVNGIITFGTESTIIDLDDHTNLTHIIRVDDNRFMGYSNTNKTEVVVCDIDGTDIISSTVTDISETAVTYTKPIPLTNTTFIINTIDATGTPILCGNKIGTISTNGTVTLGNIQTYVEYATSARLNCELTNTSFLHVTNRAESDSNMVAVVGTETNGSIAYGTPLELNIGISTFSQLLHLTESRAVLIYNDTSELKAIVLDIAGTTVTKGDIFTVPISGVSSFNLRSFYFTTKLTDTKLCISSVSADAGNVGYSIIAQIIGESNALEFGTPVSYADSSYDFTSSNFDKDELLIFYADITNAYKGTYNRGDITDLSIDFDINIATTYKTKFLIDGISEYPENIVIGNNILFQEFENIIDYNTSHLISDINLSEEWIKTEDGFLGADTTGIYLIEGVPPTLSIPLPKLDFNDSNYFEDASFTVAYDVERDSWLSFYDFKPNYYVGLNDFFMSGNNSVNYYDGIGLWSHLLTNKSYLVYYGRPYKWTVEVPLKSTYARKILESIQYQLTSLRYIGDDNVSVRNGIGFNELVISSESSNSGNLLLNYQKAGSPIRVKDFPQTINSTSQNILATQTSNHVFNVNYFFNRMKDVDNGQPQFTYDNNQIEKVVNHKAISFAGKRLLERMRGSDFLFRFTSTDTQHKQLFRINLAKTDIENG